MSQHQPDIVDLPSHRFAEMLGKVLAAQKRLAPPRGDVAAGPVLPFEVAPDLAPSEDVPGEEMPLRLGDYEALLTLDDADPTDNTWLSATVAASVNTASSDDESDDDVLVLDDEYRPEPPFESTPEAEPVGGNVTALLQDVLDRMAAHEQEAVAEGLPDLDDADPTDNMWQGMSVHDTDASKLGAADVLVLDDAYEVPAGPILQDAPEDDLAGPSALPRMAEPSEGDVESLLRDVMSKLATLEEEAPAHQTGEPQLAVEPPDDEVLVLDLSFAVTDESAAERPVVDIHVSDGIHEQATPPLAPAMIPDDPALPPQQAVAAVEPSPALAAPGPTRQGDDLALRLEGVLAEISMPLGKEVPDRPSITEEAAPEVKLPVVTAAAVVPPPQSQPTAERISGGLPRSDEPAVAVPPPPAAKAAPVEDEVSDAELTPLLQGVLSKLAALGDDTATATAAVNTTAPEFEDVLVLDEAQMVPIRPQVVPSTGAKGAPHRDIGTLLQNVLSAMTTLRGDGAAPQETVPQPEPDEDILVLAEDMVVPAVAPPPPEPLSPPPPSPPAAHTAEDLERLISVTTSPGTGTLILPERLDALATLLTAPPGDDFQCLDLLYACWPKGTVNCDSRALLAVAGALAANFGLPGQKLPMATSKAWRMLDPAVFEFSLATRLGAIGDFIVNWQKTQKIFLVLEFAEIELIEYLFESLHPADHQSQLAAVMNFKVLSNRRLGLLRRIPGRARKSVEPLLATDRQGALIQLAHYKALLERIGDPNGFAPIVEAAGRAIEEIDKYMKQVAGPPPGPPGGGMPLGRIGG